MKQNLIIKIQFNKSLGVGDFAKTANTLLDLLQFSPEVYPRDYDEVQGYIYIFEDNEDKRYIYRMLNALTGIPSFEYETLL